jgi:hypothetical protein
MTIRCSEVAVEPHSVEHMDRMDWDSDIDAMEEVQPEAIVVVVEVVTGEVS